MEESGEHTAPYPVAPGTRWKVSVAVVAVVEGLATSEGGGRGGGGGGGCFGGGEPPEDVAGLVVKATTSGRLVPTELLA